MGWYTGEAGNDSIPRSLVQLGAVFLDPLLAGAAQRCLSALALRGLSLGPLPSLLLLRQTVLRETTGDAKMTNALV